MGTKRKKSFNCWLKMPRSLKLDLSVLYLKYTWNLMSEALGWGGKGPGRAQKGAMG